MPIDMPNYLENRRKYLDNRAKYPPEELVKYMGCWIAWSPDGSRIVANAHDMDELERLVAVSGEDQLQCIIEAIPDDDTLIGGVDIEAP
jgi:hypothetical protein